MYKTISNEIIRKFHPCYDPSEVIKDENEELPIKDWVQKYRNVVPAKDILWLLLRKEFLSEKDLILFVVWCAREVFKLIENPDERSVEACNVTERYANGEATKEELLAARDAAYDANYDAATDAADYATHAAHYAAANDTTYAAYYAAHYAAFYAATNDSHAVYAAASDATSALADRDIVSSADADYDTRKIASEIARTAQVDKLLTYFE
jgi:hypothetical protein